MSRENDYIKIIRGFKFKELEDKRHNVRAFNRGATPENSVYIEMYTDNDRCVYVWIVGKNIPDNGYPGGKMFWEHVKLQDLLNSIDLPELKQSN